MTDLLKGLSGGSKQHYLRLHRAEIMAYYEAHGEAATREKYNIVKQTTWDRLLNPHTRQPKTSLSKADRAMARAEIAEQGLRDVKREVRELKDHYSRFVPYLAGEITQKFFVPLVSGAIKLPAALEYKPAPDPLDLTDFQGKLGK